MGCHRVSDSGNTHEITPSHTQLLVLLYPGHSLSLSLFQNRRSQQLPNWIWIVSSSLQCRSKHACDGYSFRYSCSLSPHLFALCFFMLACFAFPGLLSPILCRQDIVVWNVSAKDDLIWMIRSTSLVGLCSSSVHKEFSLATSEIKGQEWRATRLHETAWMSD